MKEKVINQKIISSQKVYHTILSTLLLSFWGPKKNCGVRNFFGGGSKIFVWGGLILFFFFILGGFQELGRELGSREGRGGPLTPPLSKIGWLTVGCSTVGWFQKGEKVETRENSSKQKEKKLIR